MKRLAGGIKSSNGEGDRAIEGLDLKALGGCGNRLANIQKRRSALLSRGRGYRRCSTSNCCRKQRFSAINRVFGLNIAAMAHSRSRNIRPSGRSSASRSDSPAICQRQRGRRLFCAPQAYKNRNVVERCFCRLKDFRRIATRYDKLARNFFSAVCFVAILAFWLQSD